MLGQDQMDMNWAGINLDWKFGMVSNNRKNDVLE